MTRMTFFALAAVAMIGTACERHPASELIDDHASGRAATEAPHPAATEEKPADAKEAPPAATPAAKGSAFFPGNK